MLTENFKGHMTALQPLHHGGKGDYGTTKIILALPSIITNPLTGEKEIDEIPAIHGNAIRGILRRLMMQDYLDRLDYTLDSLKVYHFLFTGGMLEASSNDSGIMELKLKQKIREMIPPISLVGSALGNQMIQGKLKVGLANLVCQETKDYVDGTYGEDFSAYNLRASDFGTRLDDLKEAKKADDDGPATQMLYEFETVVRGAIFTHEYVLEDATDVERACFQNAYNLLCERPYLGGKSATGYGHMKFNYQGLDDGSISTQPYYDYLDDNKEDICALLDELVGRWK